MESYKSLLKKIIDEGELKGNRTGEPAISISGAMFEHKMSNGFPLVTLRKTYIKNVAAELEFFIKGKNNKSWLKERGCPFWNDWANPKKVPYANDEETKKKMMAEDDLGRIYGVQWRDWGSYDGEKRVSIDQLQKAIDTLKNNPADRRVIITAWNPAELNDMALPPCHLLFQFVCTGKNYEILNLNWYQRSVDTVLGLPANIASYALLLKLMCLETGKKEGKLCGMLGDVHIYENHMSGVKQMLERNPLPLPSLSCPNFKDIFSWTYDDILVENYLHHDPIKFEIAV